MKTPVFRIALLYAALAGGFILLDLTLDRLTGGSPRFDLPHLILAAIVVLSSFVLLSRALKARNRAEATLRQARDELEIRVHERTAELARANAALQAEIAERKRAEAAQRMKDNAIESSINAIAFSDLEGNLTYVNASFLKLWGHTDTIEVLGRPAIEFWQAPEKALAIVEALRDRGSWMGELVAKRKDGSTFDVQLSASVVTDETRKPTGMMASFVDITERKRAEEELREARDYLENLFDYANAPIIVWDPEFRITRFNHAFEHLTGRGAAEVLGQQLDILFPANRRDEALGHIRRTVAGEHWEVVEIPILRVDDTVRTVLWNSATLYAPDGMTVIATIAQGQDITERKQAEEQRERLLAIEERQRLARELHDSVSQALYGISLGAHTALTLFDTDRAKVLEALNFVLSLTQVGLTEMRALIFELRPESLALEGLAVALGKHVAALRARRGIEVELAVCDEPDVPLPVKEAIYRIAQEALQNAVKHSRSERLDVRLRCGAESLELEVCDDGVGFDPQLPYPGHLGLRSMRERASSVGGALEIESIPGCGTRIRAHVPIRAVELAPSL